jgi:hypothetical protein
VNIKVSPNRAALNQFRMIVILASPQHSASRPVFPRRCMWRRSKDRAEDEKTLNAAETNLLQPP